jgi:undecaprenyl-diphosphatase
MIDFSHAFWLALLQGVTEFLPVSSSGHLVLVPHFLGWSDQGLMFDVAVHIGTLLAIVFYLRRDIGIISRGLVDVITRGVSSDGSRLCALIIVATLPTLLVGVLIDATLASSLRQPLIIGVTTAGFGVVLLLADRLGSKHRKVCDFGWRDALIIGIAQAFALIPGTSRAGITMTAALMVGADRVASARFSFLLSIPVILAAGAQQSLQLSRVTSSAQWSVLMVGVIVAAISSLLVIKFFMRLIERMGMWPFVLYRVMLGAWLVIWFR